MLKLFYAPNACSLAPHIALTEAARSSSGAAGHAKRRAARGRNISPSIPRSRVPALATDRGILTEVPVILGCIARNFPRRTSTPDDGFEFCQMQSFNLYLACTIHITFAHLFRTER